jgi:hypothetical protein
MVVALRLRSGTTCARLAPAGIRSLAAKLAATMSLKFMVL